MIAALEGTDNILDGPYRDRKNAIEKCAVAARRRGFDIFAVQDGGWCASSELAGEIFRRYGKSNSCQSDGKGGPLANNVYYLKK